jgi:gluconate 2-dehydrogenase alpha chain
VTGVVYYGPDGSDNTIEAELVILTTFIYDNTRLLLLSKTDKFPNGLANSSGQVGKHLMAHMMPNVYSLFDDRHVNNYMGPNAQKHTIDDFNADNFDHSGAGFTVGSQISAPAICRAGRSATPPRRGRPARRAGEPPIAITWRSPLRGRWRWSRRLRICPTSTRRSISIPT